MNKATDPAALLESALIDALGAECLLGDEAKTLFSTDVYGGAMAPALVVRPQTQEQVADAVRIATTAGWAITQRGGGMSYTGGYLPTQTNTVMLDLSALNRIVSINEEDLVITVEAGVTWQQIWEALTPAACACPSSAPSREAAPPWVADCPTGRCLWARPVTAAPPILWLAWK